MTLRIHEPYIDPIARRLSRSRVTPNMLSIYSLPPAILAGVCAAFGWFMTAALLFIVSGVLDLLDGALARVSARQSRFGALLDSSIDRVADACILIGLVIYYAPYGWVAALPALTMLPSMWIPYIRARAQSLGLELPRLWMRREDRFVALVIALIASPFFWTSAPVPHVLVLVVLVGITSLGFIAGILALVQAERLARQSSPGKSQ